mmetsp:Transcript_17955/g.42156  ORF Transcript_17955/g.42156 Transcript_17955/m.42156 type:complete len:352 (+) Transcript_17955:54-1109(+)
MARLPQPLSALRPMSRWFQHSGACSSSVSCNRHWNPAVIVAGAGLGLGYYSEYGNKARPGCEEGGEAYWWKDPSKCSDASSLWRRGWDSDWDGRAKPTSSCTTPVKTTGPIRHLLLIRHGQYNLDDDEHGLTDLGREQSAKLGQRLLSERLGLKKDRYGEVQVQYSGIWVSTVTRARQTAEILSSYLPDVPVQDPDPLLAEGKPTVPHPTSQQPARPADIWEDSARMEAGFRKFVHRAVDHKRLAEKEAKREKKLKKELGEGYVPPEKQEAERTEVEKEPEPQRVYEIYVCHMNLIRYFVMRALQLPPEAWLRLRGDNAGITEIIIHPDGRVSLSRFADVGHLPIEMVTFH